MCNTCHLGSGPRKEGRVDRITDEEFKRSVEMEKERERDIAAINLVKKRRGAMNYWLSDDAIAALKRVIEIAEKYVEAEDDEKTH